MRRMLKSFPNFAKNGPALLFQGRLMRKRALSVANKWENIFSSLQIGKEFVFREDMRKTEEKGQDAQKNRTPEKWQKCHNFAIS